MNYSDFIEKLEKLICPCDHTIEVKDHAFRIFYSIDQLKMAIGEEYFKKKDKEEILKLFNLYLQD